MKTHLLLAGIIFAMLACSGSKTNQESVTDSTQQIQDTVALEAEEVSTSTTSDAQPFSGDTNNFPKYTMDTFTNDSLESELNKRMGDLMQLYDTIGYVTITSSYYWERPYFVPGQDGPGQMSTETGEEKKTWFFDRANLLRGYSMTMKSSGDESTKSVLCLLSNDSLIAVREEEDCKLDGCYTSHVTILASQCPQCGLVATSEGYKNYIDNKSLNSKQQEFYESLSEMVSLVKAGKKNAKEDDSNFIFSIKRTKEGEEGKSKPINYSEEFTVAKELYPGYISKQ